MWRCTGVWLVTSSQVQEMITRQVSTGETRIPFSIGSAIRSLVLDDKAEPSPPKLDVEESGAQTSSRICCSRGCLTALSNCVSLRIAQLSFFCLNKDECRDKTCMKKVDREEQRWDDDEHHILPFSIPESMRDIVETSDSDTLSIQSIENFSAIFDNEDAFGRLDFDGDEEELYNVEI